MSGVPYEVYSYATCIIEVEVDTVWDGSNFVDGEID